MNVKYLKRKQKWQVNRLIFKKRRLKRKLAYFNRLNSILAKKSKSISFLASKSAAVKNTRTKSSINKKLTSKNYDRLSNSLVNKSISITNNTSYLDTYTIINSSRNLLVYFLTKRFNTNKISRVLDAPLPLQDISSYKSYTLISSLYPALSVQAEQYTRTITANTLVKNREFTFSKSSLKHSLHAWSYNTSKTLHNGNKNYSSFTFSDGFVPILVSSNIQRRSDLKTSDNLILASLARATFLRSDNKSSQQSLGTLIKKVRGLWLNRIRLLSSRKHSCKRSRSLRSRRRRKLSRSYILRTQKTQINKSRVRSYSYRGKSKQLAHTTVRRNLTRFISLLKGALYSTQLKPASNKAISAYTSISQTSLNSNITESLSSYSRQCNVFKTVFRLTPGSSTIHNNIYPSINPAYRTFRSFRPTLTKDLNFYPDVLPWVNDNIIRLIENSSGKRSLVQHSMHAENTVDIKSKLEYKKWITRMAYYERNLGHRFFMEEALHIIHLSFRYHDVTLFSSWLKAIITRISFWKTRSIFRFLKYVFNNYYRFIFDSLSIKGIKIRLKGKISAAGNSRKRTILFRSGKNSYSSVNIKCIHDFKTITTFTGVMGFQVWLFY